MTTPTIPASADELEEFLHDGARMAALFNDGVPKPEFGEFLKAYKDAQAPPGGDVDQQIRDQVAREVANLLREGADAGTLNRLSLAPGSVKGSDGVTTGKGAVYNKAAPGAGIDHLFADTADFFGTIWHLNHSADAKAKLAQIRNDYSSQIPADGGYLIPERLRSQLLSVALEMAIVRSRAMVVPMDSLTVPFPTIDSTSNASNVFGGIEANWTEESADLEESQARFGRVDLVAKTLTAYTEVPNQLLQDSIISLAAFIDQKFPEALAFFEDVAFFDGTGVGEPLGFLRAPAAVSIAAESGQPATTIVWENIVKMFARMLPTSLGRAEWICHIDTFPELATMALSVGTGGSAIWLNSGSEGPPATILGRPVKLTEKAKTVGTAGDVNFVDFGYYLIGDRQAMTAMSSEHFKFKNNRTAYRIIQRVDGRPWIQSAITPNQGSNTLSPFVKIATRS